MHRLLVPWALITKHGLVAVIYYRKDDVASNTITLVRPDVGHLVNVMSFKYAHQRPFRLYCAIITKNNSQFHLPLDSKDYRERERSTGLMSMGLAKSKEFVLNIIY